MTSLLRHTFELSAHYRPTVGDQKVSYVGVDHMGWLVCDGRAISRTTYALLFNVVGETFGAGDGSTTFNLPDPLGRAIGIAGSGAGLTPRAIGDSVGTETHTLTIAEMPAHKHGSVDVTGDTNGNGQTTTNGAHDHTGTTDPAGYAAASHDVAISLTTTGTADNTGEHVHTFTTDSNGDHFHTMGSTGGGQAHNNMQPTLFAGNMFIYSGRNVDAYFPYTWVGGTPGNVQIY